MSRSKKSLRKTFVIDTSVLLYDKNSIHSFPGNDVIIPMIVLDELDRHKDKPGIVGENARYVNRFLDDLRKEGNLREGILVSRSCNQVIKVDVEPSEFDSLPGNLDSRSADNRIIGLAKRLQQNQNEPVIVVTKDINFRVKCDAVGVTSEDYYKDTITQDALEKTSEVITVSVSSAIVDELYEKKKIDIMSLGITDTNRSVTPLIIHDESNKSKSALAVSLNGVAKLATPKMNPLVRIKPRNKEQAFALQMMLDDDIKLVALTGIAGSGKTLLSLMAGLSGLYDKKYRRVVITRPIQSVGKDLGYLPGDINDKMGPWIQPIVDNFCDGQEKRDVSYFEMMRDKGEIEIAPLAYIRGRTFDEAYIIVDEAQNATIHELKTIVTRVGQNAKIILLGDIEQIDTPYLDTYSNGLSIVIDKFKDHSICGHVSLPKGERSELATLASRIL